MIMTPAVHSEGVQQAIEFVNEKVTTVPEFALILGSGLGALADTVKNPVVISTSIIPNYPLSTVPGHEGRLVAGKLGDKNVVVVQGRVHMYEGYTPDDVVFPVRLVQAMGAQNLIVTNAAGGIGDDLKPV
jgi:purine-nucleoside phosphorylase